MLVSPFVFLNEKKVSPKEWENVDSRLRDIITETAARTGMMVEVRSGAEERKGGKGNHPKKGALDIWLIDPQGNRVPHGAGGINDVSSRSAAEGFGIYEQFAHAARGVQQEIYPDLNDQFRWGGYFSGGPSKYGALDTMHFDLSSVGMAGGSWDKGLNPQTAKAWEGAGYRIATNPEPPTQYQMAYRRPAEPTNAEQALEQHQPLGNHLMQNTNPTASRDASAPPSPEQAEAVRRNAGMGRGDLASGIQWAAGQLGIDPVDLATTISYETAGTFDPEKKGPTTKWGQHRGLIQWGEQQAQKYINNDFSIPSQMQGIVNYMRDAGVEPGMGLLDVYSAVNAGRVGRYNASDTAAGGAPGTVADKVRDQMAGHRTKAEGLMKMAGGGGQSEGIIAQLLGNVGDAAGRIFPQREIGRAEALRMLNSDSPAARAVAAQQDVFRSPSPEEDSNPMSEFAQAAQAVQDAQTPAGGGEFLPMPQAKPQMPSGPVAGPQLGRMTPDSQFGTGLPGSQIPAVGPMDMMQYGLQGGGAPSPLNAAPTTPVVGGSLMAPQGNIAQRGIQRFAANNPAPLNAAPTAPVTGGSLAAPQGNIAQQAIQRFAPTPPQPPMAPVPTTQNIIDFARGKQSNLLRSLQDIINPVAGGEKTEEEERRDLAALAAAEQEAQGGGGKGGAMGGNSLLQGATQGQSDGSLLGGGGGGKPLNWPGFFMAMSQGLGQMSAGQPVDVASAVMASRKLYMQKRQQEAAALAAQRKQQALVGIARSLGMPSEAGGMPGQQGQPGAGGGMPGQQGQPGAGGGMPGMGGGMPTAEQLAAADITPDQLLDFYNANQRLNLDRGRFAMEQEQSIWDRAKDVHDVDYKEREYQVKLREADRADAIYQKSLQDTDDEYNSVTTALAAMAGNSQDPKLQQIYAGLAEASMNGVPMSQNVLNTVISGLKENIPADWSMARLIANEQVLAERARDFDDPNAMNLHERRIAAYKSIQDGQRQVATVADKTGELTFKEGLTAHQERKKSLGENINSLQTLYNMRRRMDQEGWMTGTGRETWQAIARPLAQIGVLSEEAAANIDSYDAFISEHASVFPKNRVEGSGAMSDWEGQIAMIALFSPNMSEEAVKERIDFTIKLYERQQDMLQFIDQYVNDPEQANNYNRYSEAEAAWAEKVARGDLDTNPIFFSTNMAEENLGEAIKRGMLKPGDKIYDEFGKETPLTEEMAEMAVSIYDSTRQ